MTKMRWDRPRYTRTPTEQKGRVAFPARFGGRCVTCRTLFPAGTKVILHPDGGVCHSGGCPRKAR